MTARSMSARCSAAEALSAFPQAGMAATGGLAIPLRTAETNGWDIPSRSAKSVWRKRLRRMMSVTSVAKSIAT